MSKIAFFSESNFEGKIPRNFENMRTEYAWYVALDAIHHHIGQLQTLPDKHYDLGIVIIPKMNVEEIMKFPMIEQMKRVCNKIGYMQEGPHWYFQDYPMEQQIWFYNTLMDMDVIFTHNQSDVKYFKGLTQKENVYQNKSLMITDYIEESDEKINGAIIGGNMVRWYGGFDSYVVAQEFDYPIFAPSMGRRIENEEIVPNLTHYPYLNWNGWIKTLATHKYAVHMMPTIAAGTFAMNCAFLGIPCIGYENADTQRILHPDLSVKMGDIKSARLLAYKLKNDKKFLENCSKSCKLNYEQLFIEREFVKHMEKVLN